MFECALRVARCWYMLRVLHVPRYLSAMGFDVMRCAVAL